MKAFFHTIPARSFKLLKAHCDAHKLGLVKIDSVHMNDALKKKIVNNDK